MTTTTTTSATTHSIIIIRRCILFLLLIGSNSFQRTNVITSFTLSTTTRSPFSHLPQNGLTLQRRRSSSTASPSFSVTQLNMSLKPAAIPLMESGKALARAGECLIDLTSTETLKNIYGGALSAAGAQMRNAGDSVAQAAASCRFKTGTELVIDELREAAVCFKEATDKLKLATEEAQVDDQATLAKTITSMVSLSSACSDSLEAAGAAILQRQTLNVVGRHLTDASATFTLLSTQMSSLAPNESSAQQCGQYMTKAATLMEQAGNNLQGIQNAKPTGKSWLKGGGGGL